MQEESNTADKMVVQDKRSIYYVRYPNLAIYYCLTMASGHYLPILYHSISSRHCISGWVILDILLGSVLFPLMKMRFSVDTTSRYIPTGFNGELVKGGIATGKVADVG